MNFLERAQPLAQMGVPVIRLRPRSKAAVDTGWPELATTDLEILQKWNTEMPDANCGAVASHSGIWLWEVDSPDVASRIERDTGHDIITEIQTFKVRSRKGRGHFYFKQTDASRSMGNVAQTYVVGQDFSCRVDNAYCVGPNSIHPDTGEPYTALNHTPIAEAPQWLTDWIRAQKIQKHSAPHGASGSEHIRNANGKVPHGAIHNFLLTQAGKLRAMGLDQEQIEPALLKIAYDNCEPPLDDKKIITMSHSICNFPAGPSSTGGYSIKPSAGAPHVPPAEEEDEDPPEFQEVEYPVFPDWVMGGTSIYEGFVKPYCEKNSRIPYFMWLPTAVMMLNYVGTRVHIPFKSWKPSFYIVLIGEKGRGHKSSSIKDGIKFLNLAGMSKTYSKEVKSADGMSVVFEAGSSEGLGTDMQRINCKNMILFYDELETLVKKAGIEGSSLNSALLKMYESANFANSIKSKKDAFSIAPDSYVATVVTATTTDRFAELWSEMASGSTGLKDRFSFVLQPKELPEQKLENVLDYSVAAQATRKIVDRAVNQKEFRFFDQTPFKETLRVYGARVEARAEKWALYFAIDEGLKEIDEVCVEKGIVLARYEKEVEDYLALYESRNDESKIQQGIVRILKRHKGVMVLAKLKCHVNGNEFGTTIWTRALNGLVSEGTIKLKGTGKKGNPKMVHLLRDDN